MSVFPPALLALLAAALFGAALVLTRFGLRHLAPASGALVSVPTTMLLFWALAPVWLDTAAATLPAFAIFAAVGVFFPALVTLVTFESNRRIGPAATATLSNTTPLFAIAGAALFLGEPLGARVLAGTALIAAGATLLSCATGSGRGAVLWALALPLAGAALRAGAHVLAKLGLALWPEPFAAGLIGYTVSSAVLWVAVGRAGRGGNTSNLRAGLAWFAAVGICNGSAVLLLYAALSRAPVSMVSPIVASYPLVTLLASALLPGGERIGRRARAGVVAGVAGVIVLLVA